MWRIFTIWESEKTGTLSWTRVMLTLPVIALTYRIFTGNADVIWKAVLGIAVLCVPKVTQALIEKGAKNDNTADNA